MEAQERLTTGIRKRNVATYELKSFARFSTNEIQKLPYALIENRGRFARLESDDTLKLKELAGILR